MRSILKRIEKLEKENAKKTIPTYEEFICQWSGYDELTKAVYIAEAECLGLTGTRSEYMETVCRYRERMGLVTEHYSLDELVAELGDQCNRSRDCNS